MDSSTAKVMALRLANRQEDDDNDDGESIRRNEL